MKMSKFLKAMLTLGVMTACVWGLAACQNGSGSSAASGGTAATVNGTTIPEQKVTDTIEGIRAQSSLETEEAWGQFLASNDMTPEEVRSQIIDSLVDQELIKSGAAELQISVESSEVDTYVESMKANFDSDEAWQEALTQAGFTEDEYRQNIEVSLLQQQVSSHFESQAEITDEEILESAKTYAQYYNGSKRSSHILFAADDEATAQDVLNRINSGSLDFAEAARQYSTDTGSAQNGGDVGWDTLNSFVTEYTDALKNLELNQVSGLVTSQYGIHIIKVTDVFNAPEEITSLDQIPAEFQESLKSMASSTKASSDYQTWLDGLKEAADIKIEDMPSDVPYNVDPSKYKSAESEEATEGDASAEESASGEAASAESASAESAEASASAESASAESAEASASAESASAQSAAAE